MNLKLHHLVVDSVNVDGKLDGGLIEPGEPAPAPALLVGLEILAIVHTQHGQ